MLCTHIYIVEQKERKKKNEQQTLGEMIRAFIIMIVVYIYVFLHLLWFYITFAFVLFFLNFICAFKHAWLNQLKYTEKKKKNNNFHNTIQI